MRKRLSQSYCFAECNKVVMANTIPLKFSAAGTNLDADVAGYNAAAAQASANSRYCRTTSALNSLSIEKH
jgi:hypothetical protein